MAKKKLKVGILFGGKSTEHEVSIETAKNIIGALDKKKYSIIRIKISKEGKFNTSLIKKADVIFPVLHGPYGEDGSMQGFLKISGVPFVGASVLGSALGMDKDVMKRLLRDAGIPVAKFILGTERKLPTFLEARKKLGLPLFIKPANTGSSVGVSKVKNSKEFSRAIKEASKFDLKIIIEEAVAGREIECGVIGNGKPRVSLPGEIIPNHEFYSYEAKYLDPQGAVYKVPASLPKKVQKQIQELAEKTFKVLSCEGMGRVDFFLKKNGQVLVNEINTIPGPVMFRRLWEASGVPFPKLLDELIRLAVERFRKEERLKHTI